MTRDQVNRTLRLMEHVRMLSYEAETKREERKLTSEYGRLWRSIKPYIEGTKPYQQDAANEDTVRRTGHGNNRD